jgi:hypothetical protein
MIVTARRVAIALHAMFTCRRPLDRAYHHALASAPFALAHTAARTMSDSVQSPICFATMTFMISFVPA